MSAHPFHEFDSVVVQVPLGEPDEAMFPAGTRAAIIDLGPDYALVEIVEQDGTVHGPYGVGLGDLRLIERAPAA